MSRVSIFTLPDGTLAPGEWVDEALCAQDPLLMDIWFPSPREEWLKETALKKCGECPVLKQCREWTLASDKKLPSSHIYGIQGGISEELRRLLSRHGVYNQIRPCCHCKVDIRPNSTIHASDIVATKKRGNSTHCESCFRWCKRGESECHASDN